MRSREVFLLLLLGCLQTGFDWGPRKSLKELVQEAPAIVLDEVRHIQSRYGEYLGREDFIYTYVTVDVKKWLKGGAELQRLNIQLLGGQIGDRMIEASRGLPFKEGEEVLLFLRPLDETYYTVYSKSGKLAVVEHDGGTYFDTSRLRDSKQAAGQDARLVSRASVLSHITDLLEIRRE